MREPLIEKISTQLVEPAINIEAIIRSLGIEVQKGADLPEKISGEIKLDGDRFVISSSGREHDYRQRFSLAHELGHYILHRDLIGQGLDDNTKYRSTNDGNFYNTSIELVHERQANSFAASILMPEKLVRLELEKCEPGQKRSLKDLYRTFEVSPSAMKWRLENLELVDRVDMVA